MSAEPSLVRPVAVGLVGRRCLQFALDRLLVGVPVTAALVLVALLVRGHLLALVVGWLVLVLAGLLLMDTWWPLRHGGQTPAMRWLGLRVVTLDGAVPGLGAYLVRTLLLVVDGFLWGLLGAVIMLGNPRRQRLGDIMANTEVVRVS